MSKKTKNWWENQEDYYANLADQEDDQAYNYSFEKTKSKTQETAWDYYKRTGKWRGVEYYQRSLVDYGYIEKMANAFAARFDIKIESGSQWSSDIKDKKLIYEPMSLMSYPKARIIALLLHEVGHLKFTGELKSSDSPYLMKYKRLAKEVLNVFEDFRIDKIMLNSYEGAGDVYEAMKPVIEEVAQQYEKQSKKLNQILIYIASRMNDMANSPGGGGSNSANLRKVYEVMENKQNIFDYLAAICCTGYGVKIKTTGKIKDFVDRTKHATKLAEKCGSTKEVLELLDKEVYPVIEELFKEAEDKMEEMEKIFGEKIAKEIGQYVRQFVENSSEFFDNKGKMQTRIPSAGVDKVPKEWADGNYEELRDSVDTPIKELVRKLTYLKKEESVPRYLNEQKRGRLHTKNLYKQRAGSDRLFKKRLEDRDTVRSFAFSIVLDKSGSMRDDHKIIHSARAVAMFSEVFERMKIPYDIQFFGSDCVKIKKFGETVNNAQKRRIGGVVKCDDGSTDLYRVFCNGTDLEKQPEKNKVMIIISDGAIGGGIKSVHETYMDKLKKKGMKFIGVGLNCDDSIVRLCYNNGFVTDIPDKLPVLFSDMLKQVIFQKGNKNIDED